MGAVWSSFTQALWIILAVKKRDGMMTYEANALGVFGAGVSPNEALAKIPNVAVDRPWRQCKRADGEVVEVTQRRAWNGYSSGSPAPWIIIDVSNLTGPVEGDAAPLKGLYNVPWLEAWADSSASGQTGLAERSTSALDAKTAMLGRELAAVNSKMSAVGKVTERISLVDGTVVKSEVSDAELLERQYRETLDVKPGTYGLELGAGGSPTLRCPS